MSEPITQPDGALEAQPADPDPAALLATAVQQDSGPEGGDNDDDEFDRARALEKIHKANSEAAGLRRRVAELQPLAEEYRKFQESQKSETQRAMDARAEAEARIVELTAANARLMAAAAHNLPPDLIDYLGSGSEDEINERAKFLAGKLAAATAAQVAATQQGAAAQAASRTRPVESLRPGAAPASGGGPESAEEWFRRIAGRT